MADVFCVQKHKATKLHYDFRIQIGDVLKSWAIPKGPSINPKDKRLAVLVEDHALDYADFEGYIEEGSYGAGVVLIWDRGKVNYKGNPAEGLKSGRIEFTLDGKRLKGKFVLLRLKGQQKNWLLIKSKDEFAKQEDVVQKYSNSILSGHTIDDLERLRKEGKLKQYRCE